MAAIPVSGFSKAFQLRPYLFVDIDISYERLDQKPCHDSQLLISIRKQTLLIVEIVQLIVKIVIIIHQWINGY